MTMLISHIACEGASLARAQRGRLLVPRLTVLLCLADLGFIDARAIAQEFVGEHRWRTAMSPTVLTLEGRHGDDALCADLQSDARDQHRRRREPHGGDQGVGVSCRMALTERMWDPNVDSGRHLFRNTCRAGSEQIALYSAPALSSSHLAALERAKIIFAQPRPEGDLRGCDAVNRFNPSMVTLRARHSQAATKRLVIRDDGSVKGTVQATNAEVKCTQPVQALLGDCRLM